MIVTPAMRRARSEGRRRLLAVVAAHGRAAVAGRLAVSTSVVSHWTGGRARPAMRLRLELQAAYGIDPDSWLPPTDTWKRRDAYRRAELQGVPLRTVADRADACEGAVRNYLNGAGVSPTSRERIEAALRELGLADAVRQAT